jgi:hypothetical protein
MENTTGDTHMGQIKNTYKIVFGTAERERPPSGRPTHGLVDNIKLHNREESL